MVYLEEFSTLFSCHSDWEHDRGEEVLLNLLDCYYESLTLGGIKSEIIFSHRFLNTSLPLITVPISIPTPPWKLGLNTHNPLPAPESPPCNPSSTFKHFCHFSCLLYPLFSGPGYKLQKTSKAASCVYGTKSIYTAALYKYLRTEKTRVFSIKPLISKNADTALEEEKRCLQVLIKQKLTEKHMYSYANPQQTHLTAAEMGVVFPQIAELMCLTACQCLQCKS